MGRIAISNIKIRNLGPMDFYNNEKYKLIGINSGSSTLVPWYKEVLREAIGDKIEVPVSDLKLSTAETQAIKTIFEQKIDETLPLIEQEDTRYRLLEWKGKTYKLRMSLNKPNSRRIWDYYTIVTIAEECLKKDKPMYITIE